MSLGHSPSIITQNLVLCLDAANPKNYNLTEVEVLVVAGGGAGGQDFAGGGGGGGVIYNSNFSVTPGSALTVTVGSGGARPIGGSSQGSGTSAQGSNSIFGSLTAIGGGAGAGSASGNNAGNGGSGGGAGSGRTAGTGTSGQGFAGASTSSGVGGGGGGAGGSGYSDGRGGPGLGFNISGLFTYYGGGGGGTGSNNESISGGIGGGGTNGGFQAASNNGAANTGGGGSAYYGTWGGAGNGGSGIVIVRYPGPQKAIGGTVTSVAGHTIHTFTTVGSTTFTPLVATNNSAILGLSDFSGNGNFGTTANSPTYSSANGGSVSFDGSNEYASIAYSPSLNFPTALTISVWFYSGTNSDQTLYLKGRTDSDNYNPYISNSGYYAWTGSNGRARYLPPANYIENNTWYNLTVSHTSGSTPNVYKNGVLSTAHTFAEGNGTYALGTNSNPVSINADVPRGTIGSFNGKIASIQAYNRALTASEIQQNFQALRGRFGI